MDSKKHPFYRSQAWFGKAGRMNSTVVLHVSPQAVAGGPLALGQNGDMVDVDFLVGGSGALVARESQ